jgi:hypothetical protein
VRDIADETEGANIMNRLVVAGGVMVLEVATHAVFAGTQSSATWWSIAIPTLLGAGPAVYKAADACFRLMIEGGATASAA